MYPTKNTLSEKIRHSSVALLQDRLSNAIDMLLQTKQAHWNVKGEDFIALHKLFDEVHESAEEWVDLIAERIQQLGGPVLGTAQAVAHMTKLPEYPGGITDGMQHVDALSRSLAYLGELTRTGSEDADKIGDPASTDIFVQITRSIDKYLWMVESHLLGGKIASSQKVAKPVAV